MKFSAIQVPLASALVLLAPSALASQPHRFHHLHDRQHAHPHRHVRSDEESAPVTKRSGQCQFPSDDGNLVAITPNAKNAGWAMSPDQECVPGSYCPIACKPGMVMAQWDPDSKYEYPSSMNGGLYCDDSGKVSKPFSNKPYCVDGTGTVQAVNKCGKPMSWCQTVLPGNEAMLIPTLVNSAATIAVPDPSYWGSTAAHFYVNPPGVGEEGCIWGESSTAIGNWAPYVAGANTNADGSTFLTVGWNPVWEASGLKNSLPNYGLEIQCPDGGCTGLPCKIDPSQGGGSVESKLTGTGAGNSKFCVVTLSSGKKAQIVAYNLDGSSGDPGDDDNDDDEPEDEPETSAEPTTTAQPTTSEAPPTTSTTSTSTSTTTTSVKSTTKSTSESTSDETTSTESTSSKKSSSRASTSVKPTPTPSRTPRPGIFFESGSTSTFSEPEETSTSSSSEEAAPTPSDDEEGEAGRPQGNAAVAGLVVAFIAAACFF
ncbi:hypothetical protein B0I35DRAFT_12396 [Stachybotrys elegans]|uniref:Uncharacterized protein n=1 Tax=Stachybotrys elegans TaxID=80388 RepID=A0A8K0T545_9HYPO|nr:hypothetical protein B0I35DRAFT_12396 [Stachybotrys elegans]